MKIAVWYHCVLNGERIPSEDNAISILSEQMNALKTSGLAKSASEIHIGVNGGDHDALTVCAFAPDKSVMHVNKNGQSELATMNRMRDWLTPGWAVLYHHIKAVQHPMNHGFHNWRRNMEKVCVGEWKQCVAALENGYDAAGAHWFTPFKGNHYPPGQRYFAGNFWWARSEYLMNLQPLVEPQFQHRTEFENRYEAEVWIGKSESGPRILDLYPNMPLC